MTTKSEWFSVDRSGLAKILRRKGVEFAVFELIQNAWDEPGVTKVDVTFHPPFGTRKTALLEIEDDAPEGFKDLRHAYTLFAESAKKGNVHQRGRFNLGEKLVLALCDHVTVLSTTGSVAFGRTGRYESKKERRAVGTKVVCDIQFSKKECQHIEREVLKLLPPPNIVTTFNGVDLKRRQHRFKVSGSLLTELADEDGALRKAWRTTDIHCHELRDGEQAFIYEMGIPVVEHDCAFHCDVQQKVPLTLDRENVNPQFLRALRLLVFNATHDSLSTEQVNQRWTQAAIEHPDVEREAVDDYMTKRFGERRVSYDVSDPEANNKAVANGYTLVTGGMLSKAAWGNVREAAAIAPAGKVFPTHPDNGTPFIAAEETAGMKHVRRYACEFAAATIGCDIVVKFGKQVSREVASFGGRELQFNVRNLGASWFNLKDNRLAIDDLIIHELGHYYESNHLSEKYYDALTRIAAKALEAARAGSLR